MICERYSCRMSEMACFIRRRNALSQSPATYNKPGSGDTGCKDCEQGTAIAARTNPDQAEAYSAGLRTVMSNGALAVMAEKRATKKRGRPAKQAQVVQPVKKPTSENRGDMKPFVVPEIKSQTTDRKPDGDVYVVLDMNDYPQLFKSLQNEARAQFRTIENQILYLLHSHISIQAKETNNAEQD